MQTALPKNGGKLGKQVLLFAQQREVLLSLIFFLGVSVFFHFYLFAARLHFLGDEATHLQTIKDIAAGRYFPTTGPSASVGTGSLYHGAFYYYLLVIPGLLVRFNPVGMAAWVAGASVVSAYLLYDTFRIVLGPRVAWLSVFLYVISYNVNHFSRWLWNPNLIPFFMSLALWSLARVVGQKTRLYLPLFIFSLSAITQLHLSGYLFLPIIIIMLFALRRESITPVTWCWVAVAFLVPWLPSLYHEVRHAFPTLHALWNLLRSPSQMSLLDHLNQGMQYARYFYYEVLKIDGTIPLAVGVSYFTYAACNRHQRYQAFFLFSALTLLLSLLEYGFYPEVVQVHFAEPLFPLAALSAGILLDRLVAYRELIPVGFFILYTSFYGNVAQFKTDVVNGERTYATENVICQKLQERNITTANLILNGTTNPNYLAYVCANTYGIETGGSTYTISANLATGQVTSITP